MVHHIYLEGIVGKSITKKSVVSNLSGVKADDTVLIHIHSNGGDVEEGWAIHDYLVSESQTVGFQIDTVIEGVCKSIATLFFALGQNRIITPNSRLLIHNPWGKNEGDAASMIRYAEALAIEENKLAEFYASSIGANVDQVRKWMEVETEYNAQQAVSMGFATAVGLDKADYQDMKAVALISKFHTNNKPKMSKPSFNVQGFVEKAKRALKALTGEIKAFDATLEDGTAISIESESETPVVGDMVTLTETGEAVADGSYVMSDGTTIEVVSGAITVITPVAQANASADLEAKIAALEAENATMKAALEVAEPILEQVKALQAKTGAFSPASAQTKPRTINAQTKDKGFKMPTKAEMKPNQRLNQPAK